MSDYLFDSGILIRHLRNHKGYPELTDRLADEANVYISVMTRFEIVRGMKIQERESTFSLLESLDTIVMTNEIADIAGEIFFSGRARGVTFGEADAIIAATAIQHGLALVTTNAKHFSMHNMVVYEADEVGNITLRE
ncbi:MAG: PIN domain-containing protein [Anaerolineae bacterium]|nr:PIN domain-containing protein [Anaerolineae bacterium]